MQYDPIKKSLGKVFNKTPLLRVAFYKMLNLLLLRAWYINRELKLWMLSAPQAATILDAGSGFGQYVYGMAKIAPLSKIKGVDVKQEQIEDCNNFFDKLNLGNRVKFEMADLTQFSEPDSYNLILSVDVMEHIAEDELVMSNLYKSLKQGGVLIISTPSDKGGSDTHHSHESDEVHGFIDEHVRDGYNINDIEQKLMRAGFSTVNAKYTYGNPGSLAWKLSMKLPIIMLNKSKLLFVLLPVYYLITFPIAFILNFVDTKISHSSGTGLIVKAFK